MAGHPGPPDQGRPAEARPAAGLAAGLERMQTSAAIGAVSPAFDPGRALGLDWTSSRRHRDWRHRNWRHQICRHRDADRADEVDLRLIGSAIARVRFELEGIASWRRDPWFYLDQTIGTVFDLLLPPPPIDERRCAELIVRLESFGATLAAGRENCAGTWPRAREIANELRSDRGELTSWLAWQSWPHLSARSGRPGSSGRQGGGGSARRLRRLAGGRPPRARPLGGVGEPLFARYLYEVALLPFTPAELLAAGRPGMGPCRRLRVVRTAPGA